ncbi:MAG: RrF2 family transcriptional regulator [Planctomycetota bacterium]|jgi:Rrf2 family protein
MKISSKGDYALRTILTLALKVDENRPVRLPEIAEQNSIPVKFLEQIMIQLKSAGLVTSRRGRHGGYLLARTPEKITLGEVIRLIDGAVAPVGCVSSSDYNACTLETQCVLKQVFDIVRTRIGEIIDNITFGDLCDMVNNNGQKPSTDNLIHLLKSTPTILAQSQ